MRNRRLALAAALLLAITSADGAALAVSGADFSSEEVAEAVFDEVENEGLDNQDEVQEQVQTPEMDQVEDQSSEDSFSDASGMEAAAEWQNEEAATADEALVFSDGEDTGFTEEEAQTLFDLEKDGVKLYFQTQPTDKKESLDMVKKTFPNVQ